MASLNSGSASAARPVCQRTHAQRERRIAEMGIERDRAAQRDFGAIEVIPLFERDPEVVEGLGILGLLAW